MAESAAETTIEPVRASMLLDLEGRCGFSRQAYSSHNLPPVGQKGILLRGLDKEFAPLWSAGQVIGIGSKDEGDEARMGTRSIPLHVLAGALLTARPASLGPDSAPSIYIIAPYTNQTMIPLLHAHLANTISSSQAAMELLKSVRLLQYFDLAGLAESVAEVSESVYIESQGSDGRIQPRDGHSHNLTSHILIQGIGPTVSVTSRHSGLVQANALLAGLTRNITQLSRAPSGVLVMVEVLIATEESNDGQQDSNRTRTARTVELESAFAGSGGEILRLACGHETLSGTLEAGLDGLVVVHDGLGRRVDNKRHKADQEQVVEVIKDGRGDLAGLWDFWKEG